MTTIQPKAASRQRSFGQTRRRGLLLLALSFTLVAAACSSEDSSETTSNNEEVEALLDDFYAAINARDVDALQEMSTEDATIFGPPVQSTSLLSGALENWIDSTGGVERTDDPIVADQGWRFRVAQLSSSTSNSQDDDAILLFIIVDSGSGNLGGDGTAQELKIESADRYNF